MEHMALNSTDGLDPEGIRLRASEGLLGVDYFFPGYAVWAGLIEAAADLGYDTNNLVSCLSCAHHAVRAGLVEAAADLGYDTNNLESCSVQCTSCPQNRGGP